MSGWLTAADDVNMVPESGDFIRITWISPYATAEGSTSFQRIDKVETRVYRGMTYDAAVAAAETFNDPPDVVAGWRRSNEGGGYEVTVTEIVEGDWVDVTPEIPA